MDYIVEYINELKLEDKKIYLLNQMRINKRMYLPCGLVSIDGISKTTTCTNVLKQSGLIWKFQFKEVPRPSNKTQQLWNHFIEQLLSKAICTIYDFKQLIDSKYQISRNEQYIRERCDNNMKYYQIYYQQYRRNVYEEIEVTLNVSWINVLAELKSNKIFTISTRFKIESTNPIPHKYPPFNQMITELITQGKAIAATDTSVKNFNIDGFWIITNQEQSIKVAKKYIVSSGVQKLKKELRQ